jgi:hypothetical protein
MRTYADSVVNKFATDTTGNAGAGALITVYVAASTVKAPLFDVLGVAITNPLSADDEGNYAFKVADGIYDLVINEGALSETKIDRLQIAEIVGLNTDNGHYSDLATAQAENIAVGTVITTAGYFATNDGGAGQYVIVAGGTGPVDGGLYLNMLNGNQLELIVDGSVDVKQFGATTLTGSDSAIQAALNSGIDRIEFSREYTLTTISKLEIGSNSVIVGINRPIITQSQTGDNKVFEISPSSIGVSISGFDLRGPYYGITTLYSAENTGINVSGRWDQFNSGSPTTSAPCEDILLKDNYIEGFGQSAILADNIINLEIHNNTIKKCGRDGVRTYGVVGGFITDNYINELSPGFGGIAPNLNCYGVALTMVYQLPLATFPRSERIVVANNVVSNCWTWKSLDTHGSLHCTFADNICTNSHIGMGIAQGKGVKSDHTKVIGNQFIFIENPMTIPRAGVAMFAGPLDPVEPVYGESAHVIGNTIKGYGVSGGDGAISVSLQKSFHISDNIIEDSLKAGITVITNSDGVISNNTIRRVRTDGFGGNFGISIQNAASNVTISGGTMDKDDLTMTGLSLPFPDPGVVISVMDDAVFNCDIDVLQPNRINGGTYQMKALGIAQILNSGSASFSSKNGIFDTVTRTSVGNLTVTLTDPMFSVITMHLECSAISTTPVLFGILATSTSSFDIRTTNSSGVPLDTGFKIRLSGY